MVSGTLKPYLRRDVAMMDVYTTLAPRLLWLTPESGNYIRRIEVDTDAIMYLKQQYTPADDPLKELPPDRVSGTAFPEINRSRMKDEPAVLREKGFRLRIPKKVQKDSRKAIVETQDNYNYAAYILGETVNGRMYSEVCDQGNTTIDRFSPEATWDNANGEANPVLDLTHLAQDGDVDGQPFVMDSFFIEKENFFEISDYLLTVDMDSWKQQNLYGQPVIADDYIQIPKLGTVYKTPGAKHGSVLAMDSKAPTPAIEYYYRLDPEKSNPTISYQTKVNGRMQGATTDNFGFNYRWWQEDDSEDILQEYIVDFVCVVKKPYGVIYADTGI